MLPSFAMCCTNNLFGRGVDYHLRLEGVPFLLATVELSLFFLDVQLDFRLHPLLLLQSHALVRVVSSCLED